MLDISSWSSQSEHENGYSLVWFILILNIPRGSQQAQLQSAARVLQEMHNLQQELGCKEEVIQKSRAEGKWVVGWLCSPGVDKPWIQFLSRRFSNKGMGRTTSDSNRLTAPFSLP